MTKAKAWEVTDEFWSRVEPLIPVRQRVADQTYTAVPVQFTPAFWSGRRPVCLRLCGNWGLPNTMNLKALPGDGKALTGQ